MADGSALRDLEPFRARLQEAFDANTADVLLDVLGRAMAQAREATLRADDVAKINRTLATLAAA